MNIPQLLKTRPTTQNPYYFMLTTSWTKLLVVIFLVYLIGNLVFATLFTLIPNSINNQDPSFLEAFFFSVQTMSTIGYGTLSPTGTWANFLVVAEAFCGVILVAVMTGMVFAKLSRPYAKMRFSQNILLSKFDGQQALSLRMGNECENDIVEANVHVSALMQEKTFEGEFIRRVYALKLKRDYTPFFKLTWNIFHPLDEDSPLKDFEKVKQNLTGIMVTFTGHDGTYSNTVYDRHLYTPEDVVCDKYFVDIMSEDANGQIQIDYKNFDALKDLS